MLRQYSSTVPETTYWDLFFPFITNLLGNACVISVMMYPGATAFTVIPREPISLATDLLNQ